MSKRKPMDKAQARERRNQLLESAAAARLSLTEGVREMRAVAGMTQEEFAAHRGVSARVIKAIELGQGNPTVATLNRIGEFFGLEVAFVPVRRVGAPADKASASTQEPVTIETIMAGKKAFDEYFDQLAAYVTKHPPFGESTNMPTWSEETPRPQESTPLAPVKNATRKRKNRTPS